MLDRYVLGHVARISPKAPVPVFTLSHESCLLGGAGNVAASVAALGGRVTMVSVVGRDADAELLRQIAARAGVERVELVSDPAVQTISKTRVVAGKHQQLLRIDRDSARGPMETVATRLIEKITAQVPEQGVVILADYEKGNLPPALISAVINACRQHAVPCLVDPKKYDFTAYRGATVLTPNMHEVERAIGRPLASHEALVEAAHRLREELALEYMVITCGAEGMIVAGAGGTLHVPAEVREVADVTGAGDTVTSVLAMCLAAGWEIDEACRLASAAAGIAVSKPRTYVVKAAELAQSWKGESVKVLDREVAAQRVAEARRLGQTVVFTNGCFDILHAGHLSCLERARKLGDLLVLGLNSDRSVRSNKGPGRPALSQDHRAALLAGLACVDIVVIFDEETPEALLRLLAPDVLVKGGDRDQIVGAEIVESGGGRVVTLPLVEGLSSSRILQSGRPQGDAP